jgi:hypothetical protein
MGKIRIVAKGEGQDVILPRNVHVVEDFSQNAIKGVAKATITIAPDDIVRAELELHPVGIELTAEARYVMRHPFFGELFPVKRIEFADGSPDWIAPEPEPRPAPTHDHLDTLLQLIGWTVSPATFELWSDGEKRDAAAYAAAVHLHASDNNDVVVPERPACLLGEPWDGGYSEDVMSDPRPTPL